MLMVGISGEGRDVGEQAGKLFLTPFSSQILATRRETVL